jgi:electron transport complex protein RnfG
MNPEVRHAVKSACQNCWYGILREFDDLDERRKTLDYQTKILAAAALVASLVLGIVDLATSGAIARRQAEDMQATLSEVIPPGSYDNDLLSSSMTIRDDKAHGGEVRVYVARRQAVATGVAFAWVAMGGYSGPITLMLGVDAQGKVLGARVIAHAETPGLGDKIETGKSGWILDFTGRGLENPLPARWKVKKDGGAFDQFAGATITPRAVVAGVAGALEFVTRHRRELGFPEDGSASRDQAIPGGG